MYFYINQNIKINKLLIKMKKIFFRIQSKIQTKTKIQNNKKIQIIKKTNKKIKKKTKYNKTI